MKNRIVFFLIIYMFLSSIANAGLFYLSPSEEDSAIKAIAENNLPKLQLIVGTKKANTDLIRSALDNESYNSRYTCKTEIVRFLMSKGGKIHYGSNLLPAVFNLCPEIFEMLLPKAADYEIAKATSAFDSFDYEKKLSDQAKNPGSQENIPTEEFTQRVKKIGSLLISENKKRCVTSVPISKNCEALERMREELKSGLEREKNKEWQEGPEGILDEACEALYDIDMERGYISNQREIAKISGVVDRKVLYESGSRIVEAQKELKNLKQKYLLKTNKNLPLNLCYKNSILN